MKLIRLACAAGVVLVSGGCAERLTAPSTAPEFFVIRGPASPSVDRSPLIVVDGRILDDHAEIARIDQAAIKRVDVLKGAAAIERFGQRGANGVIVITLKQAS
jgi:TonB-dependent SusC/RagA subfamily outer membrane receptor